MVKYEGLAVVSNLLQYTLYSMQAEWHKFVTEVSNDRYLILGIFSTFQPDINSKQEAKLSLG